MLSMGDVDGFQRLEMSEDIKLFAANAYLQNSKKLKMLKDIPFADKGVPVAPKRDSSSPEP